MRWRTIVAALLAAGLTAAIDVLYVWILAHEGEGDLGKIVPRAITGFLTAASIVLAVSAFLRPGRAQTVLLAVPGVGLVLLAFPAIFSIGVPLFVAGAIAVYAAATSRDGWEVPQDPRTFLIPPGDLARRSRSR
jgi:hypothetical protein